MPKKQGAFQVRMTDAEAWALVSAASKVNEEGSLEEEKQEPLRWVMARIMSRLLNRARERLARKK